MQGGASADGTVCIPPRPWGPPVVESLFRALSMAMTQYVSSFDVIDFDVATGVLSAKEGPDSALERAAYFAAEHMYEELWSAHSSKVKTMTPVVYDLDDKSLENLYTIAVADNEQVVDYANHLLEVLETNCKLFQKDLEEADAARFNTTAPGYAKNDVYALYDIASAHYNGVIGISATFRNALVSELNKLNAKVLTLKDELEKATAILAEPLWTVGSLSWGDMV